MAYLRLKSNEDACPVNLISKIYNINHNMYRKGYTLKNARKDLNGTTRETGRRRYSGYTYIYIGKRDKPKMLSRVPTDIQDACCPVSYSTGLKHIFLSLFSNNFLKCVLIHFKLTFFYFSKSFSFWVGLLTPTHTHPENCIII